MTKTRLILAVMMLPLAMGLCSAQDSYVSKSIADAIRGGQFYMKMGGSASIEDEDMPMSMTQQTEMACKGGAVMTRAGAGNLSIVTLSSGMNTFMLDEGAKTWRSQPGAAFSAGFSSLKFAGQGTCRVNGSDGWYYDVYRTSMGMQFTFYYNSNKVSVVEMGFAGEDADDEMGPMNLLSFSRYIPDNMYFCLGPGWKKSGSGSVAPPTCGTPWKDSGTRTELACGSGYSRIVVTDRKPLSKPVYASQLAAAPEARVAPRTDREITAEGILRAMDSLKEKTEGMSGAEIAGYVMDFCGSASVSAIAGVVTGELAEMAIARCQVYPHPAMLSTTAELLVCLGKPEMALEYFEAAEEIEPNIIIEYGILECNMQLGNYDRARKVIPKIIELQPDGVPEDGQVYLYRATLDIKDGDYLAAADDLFKSMSLGYFDETSATMVSSLVAQLTECGTGTLDGFPFKMALDNIFSEKNLANIRKGISFGAEDCPIDGDFRDFSWNYSINSVEEIYPSLELTEQRLDAKVESNSGKASAAMKADHMVMLYQALGGMMGEIDAGAVVRGVEETQYGSRAAQALKSHMSAKDRARADEESESVNLEGIYANTSNLIKMQNGVDGIYMPDALPFWGLYLLDVYHRYRMAYYEGGFFYQDDSHTWGNFPGEHGNYVNNIQSEQKRYERVHQNLLDEWSKQDADFLPKNQVEYLKHEIRKAEDFLAIRREHEIKMLSFEKARYDSLIKGELEYWWYDMSKYGQYTIAENLQVYFQCKTYAEIYERYRSIYVEGAGTGGALAADRKVIEDMKIQIGGIKAAEQKAKEAEMIARIKEEEDEKLFEHNEFQGFSDMSVEIPTPIGDLNIGIMDNHFGYTVTDVHEGIKFGKVGGREIHERVYEPLTHQPQGVNSHVKGFAQGYGSYLAETLAKGLRKEDHFKVLATAFKAAKGDLFKVDGQTWHGQIMDSQGNVLATKTTSRSMEFAGVKYTRESIQIGAATKTKAYGTFPAMAFLNVKFGRYIE